MSEQQSLKCVLPAHQAQTGARFSKYFISQGGTKEKQPDSQWELNITLMLRTYEKKWPSSGQKKKSFFRPNMILLEFLFPLPRSERYPG